MPRIVPELALVVWARTDAPHASTRVRQIRGLFITPILRAGGAILHDNPPTGRLELVNGPVLTMSGLVCGEESGAGLLRGECPSLAQPEVTEILAAKNGGLPGTICLSDSLRGDAGSSVRHTAGDLGFDKVESDLLPVRKSDYVARLTGSGKVVAMPGAGINDAPELRRASVGIAMGSGTDVARESADALLLGDDLGKFVETLHIARPCRIIMTNFTGTLLVDAVGVTLAAFGYLGPLLAVTIHVSSERAFILNSARLLPRRGLK